MGYDIVEFDNFEALKNLLDKSDKHCAILIEPIQGEKGVLVPSDDYMNKVIDLCKKKNILVIMDEIQTGFGRTGTLLRSDVFTMRPDMILLGKSLSGGLYPISAVLTNNNVMNVITPGDHGSTFGGNPLAMEIVKASLDEISKNSLEVLRNCQLRGDEFTAFILHQNKTNKLVKEVRSRGLMCAIELHEDSPVNSYELSLLLMERGLLCKPTGGNTIR